MIIRKGIGIRFISGEIPSNVNFEAYKADISGDIPINT